MNAALAVAQTDKKTLALLAARNLLEAVDALALHQTLADVARTKTSDADQARHLQHYLDLVKQDEDDWQAIEAVYGQVQWAWDQAVDGQSRFDLDYAVGMYQHRRGLSADRQEIGDKSGEGITLWWIATVQIEQGRLNDVEANLKRAAELMEAIGSPDFASVQKLLETVQARSG